MGDRHACAANGDPVLCLLMWRGNLCDFTVIHVVVGCGYCLVYAIHQFEVSVITDHNLERIDLHRRSQSRSGVLGIYRAEVRHLSHACILLIMRLLEVVIPNITFKFGANNLNFIRVKSG